jgi:hypothetical protein
MSVTIAECAENARLCRWYASKANNADERRFLLRMAKRWTALAVEKEREMRNAVGRLTNSEKLSSLGSRQPYPINQSRIIRVDLRAIDTLRHRASDVGSAQVANGLLSVLSQRLCDTLLDRSVLRQQRHLVVLRVFFDFRTTSRSRLLHGCFVGFLLSIGECWTLKNSGRDDHREYHTHN